MSFRNIANKAISLAMIFAMLLGVCGSTVSAAQNHADTVGKEKSIKSYVSLGDSMSNGYGIDGYEYEYHGDDPSNECTDVNCNMEHKVWQWANGYNQIVPDSYPAIVANHFGWDLTQLATSAMRVEDLHWILKYDYNNKNHVAVANSRPEADGYYQNCRQHINATKIVYCEECVGKNAEDSRYLWWKEVQQTRWNAAFDCGDWYTWDEFTSSRWDRQVYPGCSTEDVAKRTQNAVANADVISVAIGNGNFGVYLLGRIMEIIGFSDDTTYELYDLDTAIRNCDAELQFLIRTCVDSISPLLEPYFEKSTVPEIKNIISYVVMSYVVNYAGTIRSILELNPDAEIIIVGLMNTFGSETGEVDGVSMRELIETVYEPLNAYLTSLPSALELSENQLYSNAKFFYVEAPNVECMVNVYKDEIATPGSITRDRFITSIVGNTTESGMIWGLMSDLVPITREDIENFESMSTIEKLNYAISDGANYDKVYATLVYLAFEKAICASVDNSATSVESLLSLTSVLDNFSADDIIESMNENLAVKNEAYHKDAVQSLSALSSSILGTSFSPEKIERALSTGNMLVKKFYDIVYAVIATPDALSDALLDSVFSNFLGVFARCIIGDGLGAHPSATGHAQLASDIIDVYRDGRTMLSFDYTVSDNSHLLSIGEPSEVKADEHYVNILANSLSISGQTETISTDGLRISDFISILDAAYINDEYGNDLLSTFNVAQLRDDYTTAISRSDLIIFNLGSEDFASFVMYQLCAKAALNDKDALQNLLTSIETKIDITKIKAYKLDWSRFDLPKSFASAMANTKSALIANGVDTLCEIEINGKTFVINVADYLSYALECYIYAFVNYVYNLDTAIETIKSISPNAKIVLLGAIDVYQNVNVKIGGEVVNLGEYTKHLLGMLDLKLLSYAHMASDIVYIPVHTLQNFASGDHNEIDCTDLGSFDIKVNDIGKTIPIIRVNPKTQTPDSKSHSLIAKEIHKAMNIICGHVHDNCTDEICNVCGHIRVAPGHTYSDLCDEICNACGEIRLDGGHKYDDCYDAICNICGNQRDSGIHRYKNCSDSACDVCGEIRTAPGHTFGKLEILEEPTVDTDGIGKLVCTECGEVEMKSIEKLSAETPISKSFTTINIIVIAFGSVIAISIATFAIYWFAIKRRSFASLCAAFNSLREKITKTFKK